LSFAGVENSLFFSLDNDVFRYYFKLLAEMPKGRVVSLRVIEYLYLNFNPDPWEEIMSKRKAFWVVVILTFVVCTLTLAVPNQYILWYGMGGMTDYVVVQHHADFSFIDDENANTWTLEAWVFNLAGSYGRIFDKGYFSFFIMSDGALRFSNNTGGTATSPIDAVSTERWTYIAVTKDIGSNLQFWVDGSAVGGLVACPTLTPTTDSLMVGNSHNGTQGIWGLIDEFRISDVARDPSTYITQGVTSAPLGADIYTIAYWNCDEGTGTTLLSQQAPWYYIHNGTFGPGGFAPMYQPWNALFDNHLPLPAELTTFEAINGNGKVTLNWTTESELDNAGFHIYRSLDEEGEFQRINATLIPTHGNQANIQFYTYEDIRVNNEQTYYYKISDEDINGFETMHNFLVVAFPSVNSNGMTVEESILSGQLAQYRLEQNYPNPFNPSTNISFQLLDAGKVSIALYNIQGKKVRSVIYNQTYPTGTHTVSVNMEGLATGMYFYELKGDRGYRNIRKMLYIH